jgi:hypothetical protein
MVVTPGVDYYIKAKYLSLNWMQRLSTLDPLIPVESVADQVSLRYEAYHEYGYYRMRVIYKGVPRITRWLIHINSLTEKPRVVPFEWE